VDLSNHPAVAAWADSAILPGSWVSRQPSLGGSWVQSAKTVTTVKRRTPADVANLQVDLPKCTSSIGLTRKREGPPTLEAEEAIHSLVPEERGWPPMSRIKKTRAHRSSRLINVNQICRTDCSFGSANCNPRWLACLVFTLKQRKHNETETQSNAQRRSGLQCVERRLNRRWHSARKNDQQAVTESDGSNQERRK